MPLGQYVSGATPTQWAYPNGWAPLHFMVVEGLKRYGYQADAWRIATKWLQTNLAWFNTHGVFLEKYNVVDPGKPPAKGLYPSQTGFGWDQRRLRTLLPGVRGSRWEICYNTKYG